MTIAEHVSVFIAIIIGLAVGALSMNFYRLAVAGARVKWDWLTPLLAVLMLFVTVSYWWASFGWYRTTTVLTVGVFLPDLLNVILLFLAVAAVLPESVPARGLDLRRFYFQRAPFVYGVLTLGVGEASAVNVYRYLDGPTLHDWLAALTLNPVYMVLFGVLAFSKRPWVHGTILVVALAGSVWINLSATIAN